jgi:hypothetical protein
MTLKTAEMEGGTLEKYKGRLVEGHLFRARFGARKLSVNERLVGARGAREFIEDYLRIAQGGPTYERELHKIDQEISKLQRKS